jgi:hypothetical protein
MCVDRVVTLNLSRRGCGEFANNAISCGEFGKVHQQGRIRTRGNVLTLAGLKNPNVALSAQSWTCNCKEVKREKWENSH